MRIFLSTWLTDRSLGKSMTTTGGNKRLISYYFLLDQSIESKHVKEYANTGEADVRKTKQ